MLRLQICCSRGLHGARNVRSCCRHTCTGLSCFFLAFLQLVRAESLAMCSSPGLVQQFWSLALLHANILMSPVCSAWPSKISVGHICCRCPRAHRPSSMASAGPSASYMATHNCCSCQPQYGWLLLLLLLRPLQPPLLASVFSVPAYVVLFFVRMPYWLMSASKNANPCRSLGGCASHVVLDSRPTHDWLASMDPHSGAGLHILGHSRRLLNGHKRRPMPIFGRRLHAKVSPIM